MKSAYQFLAGFAPGDAISNESRVMQRVLQSAGYQSTILCDHKYLHPALRGEAGDFRHHAPISKTDVALLHLSIGSDVNDYFGALNCPKVVVYHNMTPAEYFDGLDDELATSLRRGREQLVRLAPGTNVALADSAYNARELAEAGYSEPKVLPLMLNWSGLSQTPCEKTLERLDDDFVNVLFVGRGAPNKALEDCLRAFQRFSLRIKGCRFIHAGTFGENSVYRSRLERLASRLGIEHLWFTDHIPQQTLNAIYARADMFLCMSEHEGFCAPLVECMAFDIPIVAFEAAAVPETLGNSGVTVKEKDFERIADLMVALTTKLDFRESVLERQRHRLEEFRNRDLKAELLRHVVHLTGPG